MLKPIETKPCPDCVRETEDWRRLFDGVISGRSLDTSLHDLAAKLIKNGMNGTDAIEMLRGLLLQTPRYECWQHHYNDIPHVIARLEHSVAAAARAARFEHGEQL
jgi:hypothetical protein